MPVFAIGIVELVAFVAALAVLLLLLAGDKFFKVIADVLSHVPVIGTTIASIVASTLGAATASLARVFEPIVANVGEWIWAQTVGLWHMFYQQTETITQIYGWMQNTYAHILANDISVLTQARSYADAHIQQFADTLNADLPALQGEIDSFGARISAGVAAAEGVAAALSDQVLNQALEMFQEAEAAAAAGTAAAEALAQALAGQVQSEAVTLFGQAEGAITVIQGQVQALPGQIEGVIPGIVDGIVPGIIAGAIPGILSQVIPRVQALEGEVTECLEPLCDTVTPQAPRLGKLGQLFQDLETLAVEAIILALAEEAVHDPQAVVSDITAVVQDVGGGALSGFRDLVGV